MSEAPEQEAMGGYFQLELPPENTHYHQGAILYQSARAAFRALLQTGRPNRVLIPKYICDAVLSPLQDEGINYEWYELNSNLNVPESITLENGDWLLYVNYFGVCQTQVKSLLKRYPTDQVIFDFSQAFFDTPPTGALATMYSPRKFFGVPDGGVLVTAADIKLPDTEDKYSQSRISHLLKRLYDKPENAYSDFVNAENSLNNTTPMRMSGLTERILKSVNYQAVLEKRIKNFFYLHKSLGHENRFNINNTNLVAPLCYPFLSRTPGLREHLIKNRVFIAKYWPEVSNRVTQEWSQQMVNELLPLPIDQRYGTRQMKSLVSIIMGYLT